MKKHTQIYLDWFGYDEEDPFIPCEICEARAVDIHHIDARGMGGNHKKDEIENLMALNRECHIKYGDKKQYKEFLKKVHYEFMERHNRL